MLPDAQSNGSNENVSDGVHRALSKENKKSESVKVKKHYPKNGKQALRGQSNESNLVGVAASGPKIHREDQREEQENERKKNQEKDKQTTNSSGAVR